MLSTVQLSCIHVFDVLPLIYCMCNDKKQLTRYCVLMSFDMLTLPMQLQDVDLSDNDLVGTLPESWSKLSKVIH